MSFDNKLFSPAPPNNTYHIIIIIIIIIIICNIKLRGRKTGSDSVVLLDNKLVLPELNFSSRRFCVTLKSAVETIPCTMNSLLMRYLKR
jgi:hypothetical protein